MVSWEEHQINMNPKPSLVSLFGDLGQVFWLNVPSSSGEKTSALKAAERIRRGALDTPGIPGSLACWVSGLQGTELHSGKERFNVFQMSLTCSQGRTCSSKYGGNFASKIGQKNMITNS